METTNLKIALISMNDEERKSYQSLLEPYEQITVESYKAITQFKKESLGKKYSGIIIDMFTIVSASTEEKDFFFPLQQRFPVMQVRRGLVTNEIKGLVNLEKVEGLSGAQIVENYLRSYCLKIPPRGVRSYDRKKILLQIHFFLTKNDLPIKSKLLNISQGGCFILSPHERLAEEDRIWISIDDLKDKNLISCRVRWKKEMVENEKHLLGLGIQFEELTPKQQKEILEVLQTGGSSSGAENIGG